MICDVCSKNEATVYIEQDLNGHKSVTHLCGECASKYNMNLSLDDVFQGFLNGFKAFSTDSYVKNSPKDKACPVCGLTYSQFKKDSKLGCGKCYEAFENELKAVFDNIQSGTRHLGKIPKNFGAEYVQSRELANLKEKLHKAVEEERFEEAASLRDLIKNYEKEAEGGDSHGKN